MKDKTFQKNQKVIIAPKGKLPLVGLVREFKADTQQVRILLNDEANACLIRGAGNPHNLPGQWFDAAEVQPFSEGNMLRALFGNLVPIVD